jgi:putative transposase
MSLLQMGIIKIEVSLPEAMRALEEFKSNRIKAFEALTLEVRGAASRAIDQLLQTEMSIFLGRADQEGNKRNGYESRDYALKGIGCIRIRMPVDRQRKFSSAIVAPNEQIDPRLKEDMAVLHLSGLSKRTLAMISKRVLGVEVSSQTVSNSLKSIAPQAVAWLTRDLSSKKYWALFIDGTNFKIQRRGSTEKEPSLVVLGIDNDNHMSLLAVEPGTKDNTEAWRAVFSSLSERGFRSSEVRIGIMDGLPGLEKLFKEIFPNSVTARCWVHALRNACARSPERFREAFKVLAHRVMYANSENAARVAFKELKETFAKDAERAVNTIEKDLESLLTHYRFDRPLWRVLKTTNPIERVNREFKRRTKSMDAIGEKTLEVLLAFTALRLEYQWVRQPVTKPWLELLPRTKKEITNPIESTIEALAAQA